MTRILVAGIGGVGGYIGGLLANIFFGSVDVEIFFLARGANQKKIQANGLTLVGPDRTLVCKPAEVSDNVVPFKVMDYVILCTKSYSLHAVLSQLAPVVNHDTVILPLQNGVGNTAVVKNVFPESTVLHGCVHMVSRYMGPGLVQYFGQAPRLIFGQTKTRDKVDAVAKLSDLLQQSGIDTTLTGQAETLIWEKFVFISALATATTYYDQPIGAIRDEPTKMTTLIKLLDEALRIAKANQIDFPENFQKTLLTKIESIPYESTTSMHTDFMNKAKLTELDTLTGYVVNEGIKRNVDTPTYLEIYNVLRQR